MNDKQALISVSDKKGIIDFAKELIKLGVKIISTGGTATFLRKAGITILEVTEITNFPEILNGRVKTLHPMIHAGILAKRNNKDHVRTLNKFNISTIDIVICNLYPFEEKIQKPNIDINDVLENIDIGGPTLLRAAAKNYKDVIVLTNQKQYNNIIKHLQSGKDIGLKEREKLAIDAFAHTAQYDALISGYLRKRLTNEKFPDNVNLSMRKIHELRYGENPHQKAAFYGDVFTLNEPCISNAIKLQGKELSFNNILDTDCAIECIKEFRDPTCVIVKHATPCGIASANTLVQAWKDAYATDVYSPFGGIVAFNQEVGDDVTEELNNYFLEVIVAPCYSRDALTRFKQKKNLRVLEADGLDKKIRRSGLELRSVAGGFLLQERDIKESDRRSWRVVTKKKPSENDLKSMEFGIKCVKHVKSNSVVFIKNTRTIAIGGGQTSRVDATWIATHKGKENIRNSIMASDAFFPFRDAIDVAAAAGIKAIIQPGGSIRDNEVIKAADEHGIAMVFSGRRYFRH